MTALIQRKPVIRSAYWRLHQILEEFLAPVAANAGYQLIPAFGTRLSCILDPNGLAEMDQQFVKSQPLGYLLLALPMVATSRTNAASRGPVPLIGINLSDKPIVASGFEKCMQRFLPHYLRLPEDALERARELVEQELPSFAQNVESLLANGRPASTESTSETPRAREFLHVQERALFQALVQHVGRRGLYVVGQVGLSDAIDINGPGFKRWLETQADDAAVRRRIASWVKKHPVDFIVCSPPPVSLPLVLIEYDGAKKRRANPGLADAMHEQLVELAEWAELQLCRLKVDRTRGWVWSDGHFEDALTSVAKQAKDTVLDPEFQGAVIGAMDSTIDLIVGPRQGRTARGQRLAEDHTCLVNMLLTRLAHLERELRQLRERSNDERPADVTDELSEEHWQQTRHFYELMEAEHAMHQWKKSGMIASPPRVALGLESLLTLEENSGDERIKVVMQCGERLAKAGVAVREVASQSLLMEAYGHRRKEVMRGYLVNIQERLENALLHKLRSRAERLHEQYCATF